MSIFLKTKFNLLINKELQNFNKFQFRIMLFMLNLQKILMMLKEYTTLQVTLHLKSNILSIFKCNYKIKRIFKLAY